MTDGPQAPSDERQAFLNPESFFPEQAAREPGQCAITGHRFELRARA
jgi:hypothetical protein